jgi:penicillin-binding protein 2
MILFDQLHKNDPALKTLALVVFVGLMVLLGGLWWVQVVSSRTYQDSLKSQSLRIVYMPPARGKILDRNGVALAENRPSYSVSLYFEELHAEFNKAYYRELAVARAERTQQVAQLEHKLRRKLTHDERRQIALSTKEQNDLRRQARFEVASNLVAQVNLRLQLSPPQELNATNFERHYQAELVLPCPILTNLSPAQIARFEEQAASLPGVDLELQSTRYYPFRTTAGHLLGSVFRESGGAFSPTHQISYSLPEFYGQAGLEASYDECLRGHTGTKSVLVNNLGYRQAETTWIPAEAGTNVVLTIDLLLQQAVERALPIFGPETRGAAVVMEVDSGDILAMASSPELDPNVFVQGVTTNEFARLNDTTLRPEINRATRENYAPGSIFKPVVAMACLENGLDPTAIYQVQRDPQRPGKGRIMVADRPVKDLAAPGPYDFRKALMHSSNAYFIFNGLKVGAENIIKLGQRLHLGETSGLPGRQAFGLFPSLADARSGWGDRDTANLCIGQGKVAVTPLQMAVMTAAIANGGKVLWPRLVQRLEPQDYGQTEAIVVERAGRVRDELGVRPRTLEILKEAMLADVEDPNGTGVKAAVPNWRVCGKTGTAEIQDMHGTTIGQTTWFASFAPYEHPRYAVVVMVEEAISGGSACAPIAAKIYLALQQFEKSPRAVNHGLAKRD